MTEIPIYINLDDDGLLRKECPVCEEQFKVFVEDDTPQQKEKYYCPSCGIPSNSNSFFTRDQLEHARDKAMNYMTDQLNNIFGSLNKSFRGSKFIKVTTSPLKKSDPRTIVESSEFDEIVLSCCREHVFVFAPSTYKVIYCPKCGELNFPK